MPWITLAKAAVEYLKGQPFNNVITAALFCAMVWLINDGREQVRATNAALNDRTDQLIEVLSGMKKEQAKTTAAVEKVPVAAAKAADVLVKGSVAPNGKDSQ